MVRSPDTTPYVDLRINDKDPQDVFEAAKNELMTVLPQWTPRESNVETLLLEALALEVSESIFSLNRLPSAITEVLLKLFDIQRSIGSPPQATIKFTMIGTTGYTVPVGTRARLVLPGDLDPIVFTTNIELTIAPGSTFGTVAATGDRYTADANGVVSGTVLELMDSILYVETVSLDADVTDGTDPESDEDYFARAVARFGRLSDALVLPSHFEIAALEEPFVFRAKAIDNWDGTGSTPGTVPGHITVALYGDNVTLSSGQKTTVLNLLEESALANLEVHIVDPTINSVNVTATVKALSGYDTTVVHDAIVAALDAYLDPMTWGWGTVVRVFELATLINNVAGVDYIASLTAPASDTTLTGNAPLANAGTLTITVT